LIQMDSIPSGNLPILEMLCSTYEKEIVSFHMPGHNRGKSFSPVFLNNLPNLDTTELNSTDDINNPSGPVKNAMELAKEAFGSEKTFFVTTGSTTALYAALISCAAPGDKIIVSRDAHKSIVNACSLYNFKAVFACTNNFNSVLDNHPDAVCAIITRPDYYGICHDISEIIKRFHRFSKPVIVDEAHGTHLHFCPGLLPPDALSLGADIVVQSAHKTSPALTPGSFLHVSSNFRAKEPREIVLRDVQSNISRVTTSSPSFLIAASLDYARYYLSKFGDIKIRELHKNILLFYMALPPALKESLPQHIVEFLENPSENNRNFDFTRISLFTTRAPITPSELSSELSARGVYIEFFDLEKIVLICKPDNTLDDFMILAKHLNEIEEKYFLKYLSYKDKEKENLASSQDLNREIISNNIKSRRLMRSLYSNFELCDEKVRDFGEIETMLRKSNSCIYVPLNETAGKICAECLIPYPPGIPLTFPGDKINEDLIDHILELIENNLTVNGVVDGREISLDDNKKYIKVFI